MTRIIATAPFVSVVIPVYNGEAFVADAIDSVLAQKGAEFELIVVDDGSTDTTSAILARYGSAIRVHRQRNLGEGAARNAALPYLRGEFVLFLDADDLMPAGYLERFAAAVREAPEIEVFHCGWRSVTFAGEPSTAVDDPRPIDTDPFHDLPVSGPPHIDTVMVRRSALARVGGFDPTLEVQADFDFCLRLAASGARFRGVPGNVAIVRLRPDSISHRHYLELASVGLKVLERHLRGHAHCPACSRVDVALRIWERRTLINKAQRITGRLGLTGRRAKWIGTFLAVVNQPRLIGAGVDELAAAVARQPLSAGFARLAAKWRRR